MRYKIKYNEYNVFNKINFYQLHGKLIPTVFNKNPISRGRMLIGTMTNPKREIMRLWAIKNFFFKFPFGKGKKN